MFKYYYYKVVGFFMPFGFY